MSLRFSSFLLIFLLLVSSAVAQWPDDPMENLVIVNRAGEQTVPKIGATSDGGCYVCWYDHASGNYDVYLQRIGADGTILWEENGLLISNNPQDTWITDYDMTVDSEDNAIITINDIRSGGDWDIYGYRISPDGEFLWGENGLTISDNADFEAEPRVIETTNGNFVFCWQQETANGVVISIRKVSPAGEDIWNPHTITIDSEYSLSVGRIAPADGDGVFVQYLYQSGPNYYDPRHIYLQKFGASGNVIWDQGEVIVSNAGGMGYHRKPDIISDGGGGAFSYWYDARSNNNHGYVQHINSFGSVSWTANGVQVSTSVGQDFMPDVISDGAGGLLVFFTASNSAQSMHGVYGQHVNSAGMRTWGDEGNAFVPLGDQDREFVTAEPVEGGAVVVYLENIAGSVTLSHTESFCVDMDGDMVWEPEILPVSTVNSGKGRLGTTVNSFDQVIAVWTDDRNDESYDVYIQNMNPDGTLGPFNPPPEPGITITSPENGQVFEAVPISVEFELVDFVLGEENDGFIEVRLNDAILLWHASTDPITIETLIEGDNTIVLELVDPEHTPLDPQVMDEVTVSYVIDAVEDSRNVPCTYGILSMYPSPFNSSVTLEYALGERSEVQITIYNAIGQEVYRNSIGNRSAGFHQFQWNGLSMHSEAIASGVYFVKVQATRNASTVWSDIHKIVYLQ